VYQQQLKKQVKISNAPIGPKAELRARSIFQHFGGHFENHSQIGNSGISVNIHLVGI
jgi:hypothetical protein